jgi:hypothetical protein
MVRYDYDRDDYTDRRREESRRQDRLESMMRDAMREIERDTRPLDRPEASERPDPVMEVINDPTITMTPTEKKAVNNPKKMMDINGTVRTVPKSAVMKGGMRGRLDGRTGSFMSVNTLAPVKRTRKKTKMDKTMSRCLKVANSKLRNKNGKLKKGKTMSDVMKMAHRLCKKS